MTADLSLKEIKKEWHGSLKSYVIGFITSLLLTTFSFYIAASGLLSGKTLIIILIALAVLQAIFQVIFFLHLGQEAKPRWETLMFFFMVIILLIIAIGSLWIMNDLDHRVMSNMTEMPHD